VKRTHDVYDLALWCSLCKGGCTRLPGSSSGWTA